MTLSDALELAAADLDGIEVADGPDGRTWRRLGQPFAVLAGERVEVRLSPGVATAALGTPDTTPSARGEGWVAFRPPDLDQVALDRATAWFASAWRHAGS